MHTPAYSKEAHSAIYAKTPYLSTCKVSKRTLTQVLKLPKFLWFTAIVERMNGYIKITKQRSAPWKYFSVGILIVKFYKKLTELRSFSRLNGSCSQDEKEKLDIKGVLSCCGQLWVWHMFCGQDLWWVIPLHIFHWSCWDTNMWGTNTISWQNLTQIWPNKTTQNSLNMIDPVFGKRVLTYWKLGETFNAIYSMSSE